MHENISEVRNGVKNIPSNDVRSQALNVTKPVITHIHIPQDTQSGSVCKITRILHMHVHAGSHTPVQFLYISCSEPDISSYREPFSLHPLALCSQAARCLPGPAPPGKNPPQKNKTQHLSLCVGVSSLCQCFSVLCFK